MRKHPDFLRRVANSVATRRLAAGLTQEQLAELVGTAARNIQRIESGRHNMTLITVARLADALGVSPEELVAGRRR